MRMVLAIAGALAGAAAAEPMAGDSGYGRAVGAASSGPIEPEVRMTHVMTIAAFWLALVAVAVAVHGQPAKAMECS